MIIGYPLKIESKHVHDITNGGGYYISKKEKGIEQITDDKGYNTW